MSGIKPDPDDMFDVRGKDGDWYWGCDDLVNIYAMLIEKTLVAKRDAPSALTDLIVCESSPREGKDRVNVWRADVWIELARRSAFENNFDLPDGNWQWIEN